MMSDEASQTVSIPRPADLDARAAVDISIKLSLQLMTAATTIIVLVATLTVFVMTYRQPSWLFGIAAVAAVSAFIASIFFGGRGITEARNAGYAGRWDLIEGKSKFNRQAGCNVAGLALAFAATLVAGHSDPRQDPNAESARNIANDVRRIATSDDAARASIEQISAGFQHLSTTIDSLSTKACAAPPQQAVAPVVRSTIKHRKRVCK